MEIYSEFYKKHTDDELCELHYEEVQDLYVKPNSIESDMEME